MRSNKSKPIDGLRVTVQYRLKDAKVFELTDGPSVLSVHIRPRQSPLDSGDWHVETRLGTGDGPSVVDAWGATPADALRGVVSAWGVQVPKLQVFNWEAVTRELHAVRAV